MKKIELVPGIKSSALGFGCASLLGSKGANDSKRALEQAIANGITHLDLARSYGYGDAESFVGSIIKERRKELVIASKFGIKANNKAKILAPFKPIVRSLKNYRSNSSSTINTGKSKSNIIADKFHDRVAINSKELINSLEKSLKNLKTDYLDYFMIHEPENRIENIDEVLNTVTGLKKEGLIRSFGIAFMYHTVNIHQNYLKEFDFLQFNISPGDTHYENALASRKNNSNIFFSALSGGSEKLRVSDKLRLIKNDFSNSVTLCSTFNEKHLKENISIFKED